MDEFNWQWLNIYFPEWALKEDGSKDEVFWESFTAKEPKTHAKTDFLIRDYGIELIFPRVPEWMPMDETRVGEKTLEELYRELTSTVRASVAGELEGSFEILESLRKFVKKYDGNDWTGNLSDHLQFKKKGENVGLWDYFSYRHESSPTDKLIQIRGLPERLLNEEGLKYLGLAECVINGERDGTVNSISGLSISDCVKKAAEIYKVANQLEDITF